MNRIIWNELYDQTLVSTNLPRPITIKYTIDGFLVSMDGRQKEVRSLTQAKVVARGYEIRQLGLWKGERDSISAKGKGIVYYIIKYGSQYRAYTEPRTCDPITFKSRKLAKEWAEQHYFESI